MKKTTFCAIALSATLFCGSADAQLAVAQNLDFQNCDGYGGVSTVGDGMTEQATGWFVVGGDRVRRAPQFRGGVDACTRALQTIEAFPESWLRRVSLLQSRAIHRLIENDYAGAFSDLDLADQAGADRQDPFYLRSLNINTNLIRALAHVQSGDQAAGEALAMATWERRPYSREMIGAATLIIGPGGATENVDRILRAASQMDPSFSESAFRYMFETGRFETALALVEEVLPPQAVNDYDPALRTRVQRAEAQRVQDELFRLDLAGRHAYALAALARYDEARAILAGARQRIETAVAETAPLPREPNERDVMVRSMRDQYNAQIQSRAPLVRDVWASVVEARIAAGEGRVDEARAAYEAMSTVPPSYAVIDLMRAAGVEPSRVQARENTLPATRLGFPRRDARTLFGLLLDAETRSRSDSRLDALSGLFTTSSYRDRGGCRERRQRDGTVNICYKGVEATLAVTEERALLRVAERAAEHGDRFRIERRDDIRHSIASTMYGMTMSVTQAGYETSLFVRFVPEGEECWRCISASEVQTSLASIYELAAVRPPRPGR